MALSDLWQELGVILPRHSNPAFSKVVFSFLCKDAGLSNVQKAVLAGWFGFGCYTEKQPNTVIAKTVGYHRLQIPRIKRESVCKLMDSLAYFFLEQVLKKESQHMSSPCDTTQEKLLRRLERFLKEAIDETPVHNRPIQVLEKSIPRNTYRKLRRQQIATIGQLQRDMETVIRTLSIFGGRQALYGVRNAMVTYGVPLKPVCFDTYKQ